MIIKFSFYKDREKVLKTYRQTRKIANDLIKEHENERQDANDADANDADDNLDEINFGLFRKDITMCEDFPNRVMKARNNLRKLLKSAVAEEKRAYLKYDKLIIDGEVYEYDNVAGDIVQVDR